MLAVGLAVLAVALPAQARAADGPRFLLVSAPHGATARSSPGGATVAHLPAATPLGAPTWLWVLRTTTNRRWGRVVLPLKPNGRTGWINLHGLRTIHTNTWIRASLHDRRIWLMHGSRPLASFSAAIGAVTTPTPAGRFSVTDSLATGDPSGPFGWYAFGLSGHQPHLPPNWSGGDQLAIRGTNDPASIGTAASYGCLRVAPGTRAPASRPAPGLAGRDHAHRRSCHGRRRSLGMAATLGSVSATGRPATRTKSQPHWCCLWCALS